MEHPIIITGGAGFIGSCLVKELNEQGYKNLILVDNLGTDEKWKNLVGKQFSTLVSIQDFFPWLLEKKRSISAIFHLGACSSTVETDADYLLKNNTHFTIRLADFALNCEIPFIYASSAATYGDGAKGFSDDEALLETYEPLNMYGYSKHLVDLWFKEQKVLNKVVGLKYFNIFGPNEYHKGRMASPVSKMVPEVCQNHSIRLFCSSEPEKYKDGEQVRDFLYVEDAVKMTLQFLFSKERGIFNIGSGIPSTWNSLASCVCQALKLPLQIQYIEMPQDLLGKYQNYTCADLTKSKKAALYLPQYTLSQAVEEYVTKYLQTQKRR